MPVSDWGKQTGTGEENRHKCSRSRATAVWSQGALWSKNCNPRRMSCPEARQVSHWLWVFWRWGLLKAQASLDEGALIRQGQPPAKRAGVSTLKPPSPASVSRAAPIPLTQGFYLQCLLQSALPPSVFAFPDLIRLSSSLCRPLLFHRLFLVFRKPLFPCFCLLLF